ncbi:uncharacterized protein TRIADDRAFT_55637 [Trichoplax adhaerens]|uniref:RCC1 domain-containing protein 1 n=1 Tax=Trichoplax adhaerens TaxID=10228 RepID=B3RVF9_TRIAD|nr:hypothetical protein TRIADDRAFT_55637 [Trichoplax adhaerens]EDV25494.1 hypothetical protein TRIADDRAFT_55637 [Trichoplax adhaerens]|eukprot:XP_002111527.1 hypothetical protein TRIADDRAFT_55637 [Trichoplax adhaerens]
MTLIYGFGYNLHGQVDNVLDTCNTHMSYNQPLLMAKIDKDHRIVSMTAGWSESVIITRDTKTDRTSTHAWGKSCHDQIPRNDILAASGSWDKLMLLSTKKQLLLCSNLEDIANTLKAIENPSEQTYRGISCGDLHQLAITTDEQVGQVDKSNSSWCFSLLPTLQTTRVNLVSCGKEHALILSITGEVFSFGRGSRGQLGHDTLDNEGNPRVIEALQGLQFKLVTCGGWHSFAISSSGDAYSWGWNQSYQLGIDSNLEANEVGSCIATPTLIEIENENVQAISGGSKHSACITESGKVYTWGWGKYGQLGHNCYDSVKVPQLVTALSEKLASTVTCGFWHTIVSVSE